MADNNTLLQEDRKDVEYSEKHTEYDDESTENSPSTSKTSTMCEVCTKAPSKYTCPGCGLKTCCVLCVKLHKMRLDCSGQRNKFEWVDKSQFSDRHLLNDYRFLEIAERSLYSNKAVPKNRRMGDNQHRMSPYHHTSHSKRSKILMTAAIKRGIRLRMMPDNLEKHKSNTSFYTIKSDMIEWHIEWQFVSSKCLVKDEKLPESTILMEAAKKFGNAVNYPHLRKALEDYRKKFQLCRYLIKVEGMPANRQRYIALNPLSSVADNLKGLSLVEYPTIFVLPPSYCNDANYQLLNEDEDLSYMHPTNMRHLTSCHPDFSQQEVIQDQLLDPKSSLYKPDGGGDNHKHSLVNGEGESD